ncbi:MAG: hypothetical protein ABJH68_13920 [Ilumatobacter sp.]|uniref:hypothetical protein n=1 Tax=Ilumatobacter sp. TaxID=1967498 RepID=UPI00329A1EB1
MATTTIGSRTGGSRTGSRHAVAPRRRDARRQPFDRRELERRGWRTTLEYRENHRRDPSGLLVTVDAEWCAEGERTGADGGVVAVMSSGPSPAAAWRRLRVAAESTSATGSPRADQHVARR